MQISWSEIISQAFSYEEFLSRYANDQQRGKWEAMRDGISLTDAQKSLLASFKREMHVLCLAGTWCGDCVDQCPIFAEFAAVAPSINLKFIDRDDAPQQLRDTLQICGGNRVPVVQFLSEDYFPTGIYGDKTLAKYRSVNLGDGATCSLGLNLATADSNNDLQSQVIAEWLTQFERHQLILRTSGRLRTKHGD